MVTFLIWMRYARQENNPTVGKLYSNASYFCNHYAYLHRRLTCTGNLLHYVHARDVKT